MSLQSANQLISPPSLHTPLVFHRFAVDVYKSFKQIFHLDCKLCHSAIVKSQNCNKRHQDINKTASIRSPLTNASAGQKWTVAQSDLWVSLNVVNHNNIYPDLTVSTSNVSPGVPSTGNVDVSTLGIRAVSRKCVHRFDERTDNNRGPVWVIVGLTFCGSVSSRQCCQCRCPHFKALGGLGGCLTSVLRWPLAVVSCQLYEMTQGTGQLQYVSTAPETNHALGSQRCTDGNIF